MKILMIYPPFCTPAVLPYSIYSITSFLKANSKHEIIIQDLNLDFHKNKFKKFYNYIQKGNYQDYSKHAREFLNESKECYRINNKAVVQDNDPELFKVMLKNITDNKPDLVAFSVVYSSQVFYTYRLIKALNQKGIKTVVGGPAVNHKILEVSTFLADEVALLGYIEGDIAKDKLKTINAIDFGNKKYFSKYPVIPIKTSSSCYYKQCTFCTHHCNVPYLEFDLQTIKKSIGKNKYVFFIDDMIHKKRLLDIAKMIKPLKVEWMVQLKPVTLDKKTLQTCYDAGLRIVVWGIESGNDRVLKMMKKGTNVKENEEVLKYSKEIGIKNVLYIMFGFPSETENEFLDTIDFLKRNDKNIDLISTSVFGLQPGTDVYNNPDKYGVYDIKQENRTILGPKITFKTKGITQNRAKTLRNKYKKTIEKINKFPKEMNFFRIHMLHI